jgi:hypothetical protein
MSKSRSLLPALDDLCTKPQGHRVPCDFVIALRLHFRILYAFVVMEVGTRKLLHVNATRHPTSS